MADPHKTTPWDGRPVRPEVGGWHWLQCDSDPPEAWQWRKGKWEHPAGGSTPIVSHPCWRYLGPCAPPAAALAVEAAAKDAADDA